jgi:hypothetical protein
MGWIDLMEGPSASLVSGNLNEKRKEVSEARWWLEPFDLIGGGNGVDKLEKDLKLEWDGRAKNLPEELTKLLRELKGDLIRKPKIVANAYCAIVKKLGGMPCP